MNQYTYNLYYRRNLPHIQPPGASFFITFNLSGSIPRRIIQQYITEKRTLETAKQTTLRQKKDIQEKKREWFRKFDKILDQANIGPVWLKNEQIAELVSGSLHYLNGRVYSLISYCIMSNHVHVVFTPLKIQTSDTHEKQTDGMRYHSLASIMHSLKSYTAQRANQILCRRGSFWQQESYDHCIRHTDELNRILTYTLNNPVRIGLVKEWKEWKWNYLSKTSNL